MKNRNCKCSGMYELKTNKSPEGIEYTGFKCNKCGEVLLNFGQARVFYKALEQIYSVKLSKWGESLAVRIPASVVRSLHLKEKQTMQIIAEKNAFRVVPT